VHHNAHMSDVTITPDPDGPLAVTGNVVITDADGTIIEETDKTWLCRCGFSENKPFCDGSHRRQGWTSA
jgi:CDGSH-type Zn-finger protein